MRGLLLVAALVFGVAQPASAQLMLFGVGAGSPGTSTPNPLDLKFAAGSFAKAGTGYGSLASVPGASLTTPAAFAYTSTGSLVAASANAGRYASGGLLVEQSSTNIDAHSGDITASPAGSYQGTITSPGATGPDGSSTAQQFIPNTANDLHNIYVDYTLTANTRYTYSAFVKPVAAMTHLREDVVDPSDANGYFARADVTVGGVTSSGAIGTGTYSAGYTLAGGSGWYNFAISGTVDASDTDIYVEIYGVDPSNATNDTYAGNGTDGFLVWHQQIEQLNFGTSPIRTSGTSATRPADNILVTLTPPSVPFHMDEAFTTTRAIGQARTLFDWNDGTDNNKIIETMDSTNHLVLTVINGGSSTTICTETGSPAAARSGTTTVTWDGTNWGLKLNGTSLCSAAASKPAVTAIQIGQNRALSQAMNDLIPSLTVYPN